MGHNEIASGAQSLGGGGGTRISPIWMKPTANLFFPTMGKLALAKYFYT